MWQRFTERARRVILLGQEEAAKLNSGHVGTEHLLLGLVRENEGVAAQILQRMGATLVKIRQEIEKEVQPGSDTGSYEPKLTFKAKHVLELAADEGQRMRHTYIGTEHLLLALLREKEGLAAVVLRRLGLDLEKARAQVLNYLGPDTKNEVPATPHAVGDGREFSSIEFDSTLKKANDLIRPKFKAEFRELLEQFVSLQILAIEINRVNFQKELAISNNDPELASKLGDEGNQLENALHQLAQGFGLTPE